MESRILGALSELDELLPSPQVRTCFVAVPRTTRNDNSENREPTRDRSLNDPCSYVVFSSHYSGNPNGSELEESPNMVTGVQEEIPYCFPGTSSGKQKKARSTSQPRFSSEDTPLTIEANQMLLALQHMATNNNSAKFNNNISRISKLPKSLTTTLPTFGGKTEIFELSEDLFQTSLKIHNQLTEEDKLNYFHSLDRGDALQTFKNITRPKERTWETL